MTDRQSALQESVLLLSPTLSYWRGSYQLSRKKTQISLSGAEVAAKSVTTPHAILLSEEAPCDSAGQPWKKRLNAIESQHNRTIERYSVPFPIRGVRIVPKTRGEQFFTELFGPTLGSLKQQYRVACDTDGSGSSRAQQLRQRLDAALRLQPEAPDDTPVEDPGAETQSVAYLLHTAAEEFCGSLPQIFEQIGRATDAQVWADVRSRVPSKSQDMREKFNLDVVPVEIAGAGASQTLTRDDLSAHADVIRAACQRKVDEAIEAMVEEPRKQLAEAIGNLQELVSRGGRVTAKSFNPLQAAIEKIRAFAFVADDELLSTIDQLERRLGSTQANSLTATTLVSSGLSQLLGTVSDSVNDASRQSADMVRFGRARRRVQVAP